MGGKFCSDITGHYGMGWVYLADVFMVAFGGVILYIIYKIGHDYTLLLWMGAIAWALVYGLVDEYILSADWLYPGDTVSDSFLVFFLSFLIGPLAWLLIPYLYISSTRPNFIRHRGEVASDE